MRVMAHNAAFPDQTLCAAAEAAFAEAKAFLCSAEAQQMSESDLERELHRRGQELMRKHLQGHLDQRRPRKAAGPIEGADDVEHSRSARGARGPGDARGPDIAAALDVQESREARRSADAARLAREFHHGRSTSSPVFV